MTKKAAGVTDVDYTFRRWITKRKQVSEVSFGRGHRPKDKLFIYM